MIPWRRKSYEVLPALSVRRRELRRSLKIVTAGWMFGIVWMSCVQGSRMNVFARMVGFDDWQFGLMTALPYVATLGQLIATVLIERTGLRKYQFIHCMAVSRILWLVVAAVPLILPVPGWLAISTMQTILVLSSFLAALGQPAWFTWMGDLIPRRIRGRYMAARAAATRSVQFPVVIALAILMDSVVDESLPMTAKDQPMVLLTTCLIFAVAAVTGLIDVLLFLRIREVRPTFAGDPPDPAVQIQVPPAGDGALARLALAGRYTAAAVRQLLTDPLRDRVFRRYVVFGATITFALSVANQFYLRDLLENLRFSQVATDAQFMVLGPLAGIVTSRLWGRLIDRWGRRPVLMIGTGLTLYSIMPYFVASRQTPNPQFVHDGVNAAVSAAAWLVNAVAVPLGLHVDWQGLPAGAPVGAWLIMSTSMLVGGAGWIAIMLAQSGIILGFSDGTGRSKYVAASAVLISVGGILGGTLGGLAAQFIGSAAWYHPVRLGPFEWNNWHATFLLSFLGRLAALLCLIGMPDPGAGRVRDMFRDFTEDLFNVFSTRIFYRLRIFGWGRKDNGQKGPAGRQ